MNKLELRTKIHTALTQFYGTQYGDILTIEPMDATPADPEWSLRVVAPDPLGDKRVFRVTITEE